MIHSERISNCNVTYIIFILKDLSNKSCQTRWNLFKGRNFGVRGDPVEVTM